MKEKLIFCLIIGAVAASAQTISTITADYVDHAVAHFTVTTAGDEANPPWARIRFIPTASGSCTSGSGGTLQPVNSVPYEGSTHTYTFVLGGLSPATQYQACVEMSNNSGGTWTSSGQGATFTTSPMPAVHPVPPTPPATFATDIATTTNNLTGWNYTTNSSAGSYALYDHITSSAQCAANFQNDLNGAVSKLNLNGQIIEIDPGVVCNGPYYINNNPPDVMTFTASSVSTSNNTININNCCGAGHAIQEGGQVIFGANYGCLPGSTTTWPSCFESLQEGPIIVGYPYYAHVVDANDFQVYIHGSASNGGTLVPLTVPSEPYGSSTLYVAPFPRRLNWLIVRTSTPDAQFAPEHTRVNPSWASLMPQLVWNPVYGSSSGTFELYGMNNQALMNFSGNDPGNVDIMAANIRFLGVELSYGMNWEAYMSSDPLAWRPLWVVNQYNQDIICDRCYLHAQGTPVRVYMGVYWDGYQKAFLDSYMDGFDYFHSAYVGLGISQTSGTSFTVTPNPGASKPIPYVVPNPTHVGEYHFGAGSGALSSTASISFSGTQSSQNRAFIYFPMQNYNASVNTSAGQLVVVLPPGITGTCAGASNCLVATGDTEYAQVTGGSNGSFPTTSTTAMYFVDPVFSTTPSGGPSESLFQNVSGLVTNFWTGVGTTTNQTVGTRFLSTTAGYITGIRFWKVCDSSFGGGCDSASSHNVYLWNDSGTLLATATSSGETASGWQQANFTTPVAISANTKYVAGWTTNYLHYHSGFFQNLPWSNGSHLYVNPSYVATNGASNYSDSWPYDFVGNPAVGYLGVVDISASGSIVGIGNIDGGQESRYATEGCQCMNSEGGPGVDMFIDNYIEGSGNVWQYTDDGHGPSGTATAFKGYADFYYYRNYWHFNMAHAWQGPQSDGMRYFHRQTNEWKGGFQRLHIEGSIYDGTVSDVSNASVFIEATAHFSPPSYFLGATGDESVTNNTFQHGGGVINGASIYGGTQGNALPGIHFQFTNNLAWDINGYKYCAGINNCAQTGNSAAPGWIVQGAPANEDSIFTHNTFVANLGQKPVVYDISDAFEEGMLTRDNILYVSSGPYQVSTIDYGIIQEGLNDTTQVCAAGTTGETAANCFFRPSYVWDHNVMIPANGTQASLKSAWPNHQTGANLNYFPSSNSPNVGFFSFNTTTGGGDFHLLSSSPFISGGGSPASDGTDAGVNMDQLLAAQGAVTLTGVTSITTSSATVTFVAPDTQGCPVDYSSTDPTVITNFTRVSDPGGARVRNIQLTALPSKTLYYFRVNCAVQQPTGQFHTH